jgi:hypothetical protein
MGTRTKSITDNRLTASAFYKRTIQVLALVYDFTTTKPTQAVADYTTLSFRMSLILMVHLIQPNGLMTWYRFWRL